MSPLGDVHFYAKKCGATKVSKRLRFLGGFLGVFMVLDYGVYGVLIFWRLRRRYSSVRARFCADL